MKHNSSHFLIQYSYNPADRKSLVQTNIEDMKTRPKINTPKSLEVGFVMKYITLNMKAVYSSLV